MRYAKIQRQVKRYTSPLFFPRWIQVPSAIFLQAPKNSFFGVLKPKDFRGLLILFECNHDQGKNDKPEEHDIQFVKSGEDAAESLQSSE